MIVSASEIPDGMTFADLAGIVQAINVDMVTPAERLSNNVYMYTAGVGLQLMTGAIAA